MEGVGQVLVGAPTHRRAVALAVSLLLLASPASADCTQWEIGGDWSLALDGGSLDVTIVQTGRQLAGVLADARGPQPLTGTVIGPAISFTSYHDGDATRFIAAIAEDGEISGKRFDPDNPVDQSSWSTDWRASCSAMDVADPNESPQVDELSQVEEELDETQMAIVTGDVDVYDHPGGSGTVIGMLQEGESVPLVGCRDDMWCEVERGWVWGEFLDH